MCFASVNKLGLLKKFILNIICGCIKKKLRIPGVNSVEKSVVR